MQIDFSSNLFLPSPKNSNSNWFGLVLNVFNDCTFWCQKSGKKNRKFSCFWIRWLLKWLNSCIFVMNEFTRFLLYIFHAFPIFFISGLEIYCKFFSWFFFLVVLLLYFTFNAKTAPHLLQMGISRPWKINKDLLHSKVSYSFLWEFLFLLFILHTHHTLNTTTFFLF